jgi:DNA-binding transcriptional regulator YbjK
MRAAQMLIAENGLRAMSLRSVAARAGFSFGEASYRIIDKAGLLNALLDDQLNIARDRYRSWLEVTEPLSMGNETVLTTVLQEYLDDAATRFREHTIVMCEVTLAASTRSPDRIDVEGLLKQQVDFWISMLRQHPRARALGTAIAHYCLDEMPFTVAIGAEPSYRLARAIVISRLVSCFRPDEESGKGFEQLLAAARSPPQATGAISNSKPKRIKIAATVATIIGEHGVSAVTHRAVAELAEIPNSSVAHHFRTLDELIRAGIEAIHKSIPEIIETRIRTERSLRGMALVRGTHAIALAAARDPRLVPFALDVRGRRAAYIGVVHAKGFPAEVLDAAAVQAALMVMIGAELQAHALGDARSLGVDTVIEGINSLVESLSSN